MRQFLLLCSALGVASQECAIGDLLGDYKVSTSTELINNRTTDLGSRVMLDGFYAQMDASGQVSAALLNEAGQTGLMQSSLNTFGKTYAEGAFASAQFKPVLEGTSYAVADVLYSRIEAAFGTYWNFRKMWPFPEVTPAQVTMLKAAGIPIDFAVDGNGVPNKYGYAFELMNSCMEPGTNAGQLDDSISTLDGLAPGYRFARSTFARNLKGSDTPLCWVTQPALEDSAVFGYTSSYGVQQENPDKNIVTELPSKFGKSVFDVYFTALFKHESTPDLMEDPAMANAVMYSALSYTAAVVEEGDATYFHYTLRESLSSQMDIYMTAGKKKQIDELAAQTRAALEAGAISQEHFDATMTQVTALYESGPVADNTLAYDIAAVRINEQMLIHSVQLRSGTWLLRSEMSAGVWAMVKYHLQAFLSYYAAADGHNWVHFVGTAQLSYAVAKGWTYPDKAASVTEKLLAILPEAFVSAMQLVGQSQPGADLLTQVLGAAQLTQTDTATLLGYLSAAGEQAADWYINPHTVTKTREASKLPNAIRFLAAFQVGGNYIAETPIFSGTYTGGFDRFPPAYFANGTENPNPPADYVANQRDLRTNGDAAMLQSFFTPHQSPHSEFVASIANRTIQQTFDSPDFWDVKTWLGDLAKEDVPYVTELYDMWEVTVTMVKDVMKALESKDCEEHDGSGMSTEDALDTLKSQLKKLGIPVDATPSKFEQVLATMLWQQTVVHSLDHEAAHDTHKNMNQAFARPNWSITDAMNAGGMDDVDAALAFMNSRASPVRDAQSRTFLSSAVPNFEPTFADFDQVLTRDPYQSIPVNCNEKGAEKFEKAFRKYQEDIIEVYKKAPISFKQKFEFLTDVRPAINW